MHSNYLLHPIDAPIQIRDLVTIHYFEYTKDYEYPGESHDFWEIIYADRGTVFVRCGEEEHLLSQGEMILYPPNVFHTLRADAVNPSNVFIISFTEESDILNPLGGKMLHLTSPMRDLIHSIIREGQDAFILPMPRRNLLEDRPEAAFGAQQIIRMRLEELMILLLRAQNAPEPSPIQTRYDDDIAGRIMDLLKNNLYRQISLSDITASLGYGKTYLSGVFKQIYGKSIMECFMEMKIEEARYLLRQGRLSISEISDTLAFSSPQYFSKRFRKFMKMSPRQYADSVSEGWQTKPEFQK